MGTGNQQIANLLKLFTSTMITPFRLNFDIGNLV